MRLRLILDVDFDSATVSKDTAQNTLERMIEQAVEDGGLCNNNYAVVDDWRYTVIVPDKPSAFCYSYK